jgi:hypothetical protein
MIAQFLASDERETSLLVKTGSPEEAIKLQKYMSDQIFQSSGSLKQFSGALLAHWTIGKFYTISFDEDLEALEAAEQCIHDYVNHVNESKSDVNEDFSMGVEGPTGLNQGIPHGGPGKGVIPAPLFGKGKTVSRDEDEKKLKKALDVLDVYGVKVKKTKKVSEDAMPEYFCRNPWTVEDLENYLHDDDGFSWDEVDCLIENNRELITSMLEQGKSPEEVSADLDDSCLKDLEA